MKAAIAVSLARAVQVLVQTRHEVSMLGPGQHGMCSQQTARPAQGSVPAGVQGAHQHHGLGAARGVCR